MEATTVRPEKMCAEGEGAGSLSLCLHFRKNNDIAHKICGVLTHTMRARGPTSNSVSHLLMLSVDWFSFSNSP